MLLMMLFLFGDFVDIDDPDNPIIDAYAIDKYYLGFTPNAVIRIDFK